MRRAIKRTLKFTGIGLLGIVLVLLILGLLTQTGFFRERLRSMLVGALSQKLNGTVSIGTIDGNLFQGFSFDSLAVYDGQNPVLTVRSLQCRYALLPLLKKNLHIRSVIVTDPVLHIVRDTGGVWNLSRLIKPATDTSQGVFDWTLEFPELELRNARITLADSASLADPERADRPADAFSYDAFTIDSCNLRMAVDIAPNRYHARILHASLLSPESGIRLLELRGDFSATQSGVSAAGAFIQTKGSSIEFDASIRNCDIFRGFALGSMAHDSTKLEFRASTLDLSELRKFIHEIGFLDNTISVSLSAAGEFGNLRIRRCALATPGSTINLDGWVRKLDTPDRLSLDVSINNSVLGPADCQTILPGLNLPVFSRVSPMAASIRFTGEPTNFNTLIKLAGPAGDCVVNGSLNLQNDPPSYRAEFSVRNTDLSLVVPSAGLSTAMTAHGSIAGRGFTINDLNSTLRVTFDSTRINNLNLTSGSLTVTGTQHRIETTVISMTGSSQSSLQGYADFSSPMTRFGGSASLTGFNLRELLGDPRTETNLTLRASASGSGRSIDDLSGSCTVTLFPSTYRGRDLPPGDFLCTLSQDDPLHKHLDLQSPFADLTMDGRFDLDLIAATITSRSAQVIETIRRHTTTEGDSAVLPPPITTRVHTDQQREFACTYHLNIKTLEAIADLFSDLPFNTRAALDGAINGTPENLSFRCKGPISEFYIGTVKGGILVTDAQLALALDSLTAAEPLRHIRTTLSLSAVSGRLNTTPLTGVSIGIRTGMAKATWSVEGTRDPDDHLRALGAVSILPSTFAIDFDSLIISSGGYRWINSQDIQIRLNPEGTRIMRAVMTRGGEECSVTGAIDTSGNLNFIAGLRNFDLRSLGVLTGHPELGQPRTGFQGHMDFSVRCTGSMEHPMFDFSASSDRIIFRNTPIGFISAGITYREQEAQIGVEMRSEVTDSVPSLSIRGLMPVNLAFTGAGERFPDRPQKLSLVSNGFQIGTLGPLLPDFGDLSGIMTCAVTIEGTPRSPRLGGAMTLSEIRFLFGPNNIAYQVSGRLDPEGDRINVDNIVVRNIDDRTAHPGESTFTGSLQLSDFRIVSFNVLSHGTMLLMTDASRRTIPTMYGTLYTETGPDGLRITGSLERPYLSGRLFVQDANLIFPPIRLTEATLTSQTLKYVIINDTVHHGLANRVAVRFFAPDDSTGSASAREGVWRQSPLLDRLRYNLDIETKGTTAVKMIFTPATHEELYAELEGNVNAINDQGTAMIYGEISVTPRSYYYFFRKFDASGKLKFVGPWDNPELDIKASYEGYTQANLGQTTEVKTSETSASTQSSSSSEKKVGVDLAISGTRYEPKLAISMRVQFERNGDWKDWSTLSRGGDVQSDAIVFISTGKFWDELTSQDRQDLLGSSVGQSVVSGFTSSLLSGMLTDAIKREFPFIRSAEFSYSGGTIQQGADVRLSGEVWSGYWQFGGKIFNDIGNANVTYQMNLGNMLGTPSIRNLFLELDRRVEGSDLVNEDRTTTATNSARLYYRFSF